MPVSFQTAWAAACSYAPRSPVALQMYPPAKLKPTHVRPMLHSWTTVTYRPWSSGTMMGVPVGRMIDHSAGQRASVCV